MQFNQQAYLDEMYSLVLDSKQKLMAQQPQIVVYTICIWTDPNAGVSAINFDTYENSVAKISAQNAWAKEHYDRFVAEDNWEQANLFLPSEGRNSNPADFLLSEFHVVQNSSFEPDWEEESQGECWYLLEPALFTVGEFAKQAFRDLALHIEAELATNNRLDWYAETWPLK